MKKIINGIKGNTMIRGMIKRSRKVLEDQRGSGALEAIVFTCLILLGILAIRPAVISIFTDSTTSFGNWIARSLTELFS